MFTPDLSNLPTLKDAEQAKAKLYADMAAAYNLTPDEARPAVDSYETQLAAAISKFQRAQQQAAMALAARLDQLKKEKLGG